jgi:ribonuclease HII
MSKAKCPSCKKFIDDVGMTLRYYCGYVVPDSNIVIGGMLSKDLEEAKFFEDFTIVMPPIIRKECDSKGGKRECERLAKLASYGRIKLEEPGTLKTSQMLYQA